MYQNALFKLRKNSIFATLTSNEIKLADIAKTAGVSRATVSRVLNGSMAVKGKTAQLVRQTMDRMGYVRPLVRPGPKPRLGSSNKPRLGSIALVTIGSSRHVFENPTMAILIEELQKACRKKQLNLILDQMTSPEQIPLCVQSRQVDGAILMDFGPARNSPDCIAKMANLVPSVHLFAPGHPVEKIDHVTVNDVAVGALAFQVLQQAGCRSFHVLHWRDYFHESPIVRGRAFLDRAVLGGRPAQAWLQQSPKPAARSFWQGPAVEFPDLSSLVKDLNQSEDGPQGLFLTLEDRAEELVRLLEEKKLLSQGKVVLVVAGNAVSLSTGFSSLVRRIDLDFPELIHTAVERLLYRAKHMPSRTLTFLVLPRLVLAPAAGSVIAGRDT